MRVKPKALWRAAVGSVRFCAVASAGWLATAGAAAAADTAPVATAPQARADQSDWAIIVSPYLWASALNGDASVFGIPRHVDVPFSDTVKNLDFGFMGAVEVTNGTFGAYVNGQYADVSSDEQVRSFDVGAGMTSTIVSAGAFYRIYQVDLGGSTVFGAPRTFAIEPTAGVRWTRLTGRVRVAGFDISESEHWVDPFVGARVNLDLTDRWNLLLEGDAGGFGAGSRPSLNGQAYLGYRTMLLGYQTIVRAGYRALYQDYEKGGFRWDVIQHGPVVGASIRF